MQGRNSAAEQECGVQIQRQGWEAVSELSRKLGCSSKLQVSNWQTASKLAAAGCERDRETGKRGFLCAD